jgi:hypothetical protein
MQDNQEIGAAGAMQLWSYSQARKAVAYLRSILKSLRNDWLEMQQGLRKLQRIDARDGRADRRALVERAETGRDCELAKARFEETWEELTAVNVYCLDPALGLAMMPFRQGDELAWFVFDLFAEEGLESWRFHADLFEKRRSLAEMWSVWAP